MLIQNTYFWCEFEQNEIIGLDARTSFAKGSRIYFLYNTCKVHIPGNRLLLSIEDSEACLVKIVRDLFCKKVYIDFWELFG